MEKIGIKVLYFATRTDVEKKREEKNIVQIRKSEMASVYVYYYSILLQMHILHL